MVVTITLHRYQAGSEDFCKAYIVHSVFLVFSFDKQRYQEIRDGFRSGKMWLEVYINRSVITQEAGNIITRRAQSGRISISTM